MKRIIEFGVYFLVFLLPWQTRWIFKQGIINGNPNEFLTKSLYVTDVFLFLLIFLFLIHFRKIIFTAIKSTSISSFIDVRKFDLMALLLFVIISLLSVFIASDRGLAWFFELRLLLAIGFLVLLLKIADKKKLAMAFVFSLILPTLLALWQFFSQQTFANKWLGIANHEPASGGSSVIEVYSGGIAVERWLRAYGSFDHPNILGAVLVFGIILSFWLILEKKWHKPWMFGIMALFSTGLFASLSRTAWLSLFLAMIAGAVVLFLQKKYSSLKIWISGSVIIAAIFLIMFFVYKDLVIVRIQNDTRLENLSLDQRALFLSQAKKIINENPVLGVGIGNYIPAVINQNPGDVAWNYQPVHNVFFLVWAELGIVGVFLLLTLFGVLFWKHARNNYVTVAIFVSLVPILMLDHWLWSLHFGLMMFVLTTALIAGISKSEQV
jgi:O-antigen ligase